MSIVKDGIIAPESLPDFESHGGFVVNLSQRKRDELEMWLDMGTFGKELELFIGELGARLLGDEDIKSKIELFTLHSDRVSTAKLTECIIELVDKGYLCEGLVLISKCLDRDQNLFAGIMEKVIPLYRECSDRGEYKDVDTTRIETFEKGIKALIDARATYLNRGGRESTQKEAGEYLRISGLFFQKILGNDGKAEELYLRGINECNDPPCFFYEGALKSLYSTGEEAKACFQLGWERFREPDCLLGLFGLSLQERNFADFARYYAIAKELGILKNTNFDFIVNLCDEFTPIHFLHILCEERENFSGETIKKLREILTEKMKVLNSEDKVYSRGELFERLDILILQVIYLGDAMYIHSALGYISFWLDNDPESLLEDLVSYFENTSSRAISTQSLEKPIWSNIDDESTPDSPVQLSRMKNINQFEVLGRSGIEGLLKFFRALSFCLIDEKSTEGGLTTLIDALNVLKKTKFGHKEEIQFLLEEFRAQKQILDKSHSNKIDTWSQEMWQQFDTYRDTCDERFTMRGRMSKAITVYNGESFTDIKDKTLALYVFAEIFPFITSYKKMLEVLNYLDTFDLDVADSSFIGSVLARTSGWEDASVDYLLDTDLDDIDTLESFTFVFRFFAINPGNESDGDNKSEEIHPVDEIFDASKTQVRESSNSSSFLDHVRKLYFRTLRRESDNTKLLGVTALLMGQIFLHQGDEKLAEKWFIRSSDHGYFRGREMLAAHYRSVKDDAKSKEVTMRLDEIEGTSSTENLLSFAIDEGDTSGSEKYLSVARVEESAVLDELRLEYLAQSDSQGIKNGFEYLAKNPYLLSSISPKAKEVFLKFGSRRFYELAHKPELDWDFDDALLWLSILRFRYDSVDEEYLTLEEKKRDAIRRDRMLDYWNQIGNLFAKKKQEKKEGGKLPIFQSHGRRIILTHLGDYFPNSLDVLETSAQYREEGQITDIEFGKTDMKLIALSFPEDANEIMEAISFALGIQIHDYIDYASGKEEDQDLINYMLKILQTVDPDTGFLETVGLEMIEGEGLLHALHARQAILSPTYH